MREEIELMLARMRERDVKKRKRRKTKRKPSKKAVLKALRSKKTPPQLKRGLRKYAKRMGWI